MADSTGNTTTAGAKASEQADRVRAEVRARYADVARATGGAATVGCCGPSGCAPKGQSERLGYAAEDVQSVPEGADMGLGCGNPIAIASLRPGHVVLDLGSGGGFDCFLAAKRVGKEGRVIGVDMTPEMIEKARSNARRIEATNVEFRLGEIEHLPVADASVDVVLSNCVVNLSPDKAAVYRDAFRVLRPGGRLAIADVVQLAPLPPALAASVEALTGCAAGAAPVADVEAMLRAAGFDEVRVDVRHEHRDVVRDWMPGTSVEEYVASARIEARRPGAGRCCEPTCCAPEDEA